MFDLIKNVVEEALDWNLQYARVLNYRLTADGRLQVALLDIGPRDVLDTREYMEHCIESTVKNKIDLIVLHKQSFEGGSPPSFSWQ